MVGDEVWKGGEEEKGMMGCVIIGFERGSFVGSFLLFFSSFSVFSYPCLVFISSVRVQAYASSRDLSACCHFFFSLSQLNTLGNFRDG